jgi:glucosamine--fructose-6-phosphate aminotransferase (isomerizing)
MASEACEAPEAAARFLDRNRSALIELGARLRQNPPPFLVTSARGSSDHAAGYLKYLSEILMGVPCCSMGASVISVYSAELKVKNALCVTVSQSGRSPDIVSFQSAAREAGALTIALINAEDSSVARSADICLPLCAGPEKSVAATKSMIAALVAGAAIIAHWKNDPALLGAVKDLPQALHRASALAWHEFVPWAKDAESLYVLGRGPCLPIAAEIALKLKETSAIHAEAYSAAEVMHGPLELVDEGFPVLVLAPDDPAFASNAEAIRRLQKAKANLLVAGQNGLHLATTGTPLLDPIAIIQTAYPAIEAVARARGRDPDRPRLLGKVTETI